MAFKFNPTTGKFDIVSDPGGSDTQIQFNDGGSFGGDSDLTYNKTTNTLTTKGNIRLDDAGSFTTTLQAIPPTATRTISLPDATGTVALVAGSNGQILYNNAGVNAGIPQLTWNSSTGLTFSSNWIQSTNGAASAPPMSLTGTWFTGGTSTTTKPQFLIEPAGTTSTSWSTAGTGLGINAPNGFTGNLLDLQVDGVSSLNFSSGVLRLGVNSTGTLQAFTLHLIRNAGSTFHSSWNTANTSGGLTLQQAVGAGSGGDGVNRTALIIGQATGSYGGVGGFNFFDSTGKPTLGYSPSVATLYVGTSNGAIGPGLATGTNTAGNSLNITGGAGTGTGAGGALIFLTAPTSSFVERLRITATGIIEIADAVNVSAGTTTGTKIGTATTQKLAFWDATPVVQPAAVADATDAASVITQLNLALARLRTLGLIAT